MRDSDQPSNFEDDSTQNAGQERLHDGELNGLASRDDVIANGGTDPHAVDATTPSGNGAGGSMGNPLPSRDDIERRFAEEAQARLAAIVESSDDAIISKSLDGTILSWNAAAARLFGYKAAEAIGRSITLIIPVDRLDEERGILERLRRGERIEHFETIRAAKDGRLIDISLTVSPIRNKDGYVIGASKIARDITERKRAAQALRESEERYRIAADEAALAVEASAKFRTLFEQGTLFAGILTLDGAVVEVNRLGLEACGYTREETIGRKFWEGRWWSSSPSLIAMVREGCSRAANSEIFRTESTYFVADGTERFLDLIIAPVKDAGGRVLFLNPAGMDITEKKRAEEDLRKQTERIRLLWEAASVLLTTEEPDAMMRGLFAKVAPHFGLDTYFNFMVNEVGDALRLESCVGIADESLRAIQTLEFGQAVCGAVAKTRQPIAATHIQQSADPRVQLVKGFGIRVYACNPLIAGERLLGTLSFASRTRDAFDADELEFLRTICRYVTVAYERLRLVQELRDSDSKKDEFIALLAHELRNPLAPIRNGLEVMRHAAGDVALVDQTRAMMDRQLTHMVRLIDDLLDVSRISRNKMELRRERILLTDVVNNAVETARPFIEAGGHELTISLPGGPIYLHADLTRLVQVLGNLLSNSAKYTTHGGHIWLLAHRLESAVVVSVRDNGIGIPKDSLDHIFNMFSQVDRSIERGTGGLGIGLALVKGLVEMHGGSVTAESQGLGEGSMFTVTLPISQDQPASTAPHGVARPGKGPSRRILVVDDSRDGADSLAKVLKFMGNDVRTANDGIEAIDEAEGFRPDIILMDVGLPRLNGLDATTRIRGYEWGRDIIILALTGWGQDGDRERSREAGCDGHLVKPVDLSELEQLLLSLRR